MMFNRIYHGDCIEQMKLLSDESVDCCVTSPPYWGLRDYGHEDQIGLEDTPEEYVAKMVAVFREVRRVLKPEGTLWLNLGDSYSVGSNFADCLNRIMKRSPLFIGNAATIRITAKSTNVSLDDQRTPNGKLLSLLGVERVFIKQRDNNFCQIFYTLASPVYCWVCCTVFSISRNIADLEVVLDSGYDISIIISNHNPHGKPELGIDRIGGAWPCKSNDTTFSVKESSKPICKTIADCEPARNSVFFDTTLERFPDIYFVDQPITLGDRFDSCASNFCNFSITKATQEQICFSSPDFRVDFTVNSVSHFYTSNEFGSFILYKELYYKAYQKASETRAKQELGIPEMVKRELMRDGWICRQTIIWHKPNPMPESVTDRCTKSHEYIFLLSKSSKYYYDAEAIAEKATSTDGSRRNRDVTKLNNTPGRTRMGGLTTNGYELRNKRSVWTVSTKPYTEAHFATYPEELITPCILAGCPEGGVVLDPFFGSGTTGVVAIKNHRQWVGCELNSDYIEIADKRIDVVQHNQTLEDSQISVFDLQSICNNPVTIESDNRSDKENSR